jgi:hypothetical protein
MSYQASEAFVQQWFGVIGDLVELAFFYYIYVQPKILDFKIPQPRQAPRR